MSRSDSHLIRYLLASCALPATLAWGQNTIFRETIAVPVAEVLNGAMSVAAADVNGDGRPDLLLATEDGIVLFAGTRSGVPDRGVPVFRGEGTVSIAVAELDGDALLDIAALAPREGVVLFLKGVGDGNFRAPLSFNIGASESRGLVAADLNQDGHADLAAAQGAGVVLLIADRGGSFLAPRRLATGDHPTALITSDFNGDGIPDLASANNPNDDGISVLLGTGRGEFRPERRIDVGDRPYDLVAGDFDKDGKADLAIAASLGLQLLKGTGDGGFTLGASLSLDNLPLSVATADLDPDGRLDFVLGNYYSGEISIILSRPDGTLRKADELHGLGDYFSVVVSDLNADSKPDIVAASYSSSSLLVANGLGGGEFEVPMSFGATGVGFVRSTAWSGARLSDVAVLLPERRTVWLIAADGRVIDSRTLEAYPVDAAFADVNRDGNPDLVLVIHDLRNAGLVVLLRQSDGTLGPPVRTPLGTTPMRQLAVPQLMLAVADLTGDGIPDAAVANNVGGTLHILRGSSGGEFTALRDITVDVVAALQIGDFDADGTPEVAEIMGDLASGAARIRLHRVSGGPPRDAGALPDCGIISAATIADFNGDGRTDLAVACGGRTGPVNLRIMLAGSDGVLRAAPSISVELQSSGAVVITTAKFDGDGNYDLLIAQAHNLWGNFSGGLGLMLAGNGDGTFRPSGTLVGLQGPMAIAVVNANGDGRPDFVLLRSGGASAAMYVNALAAGAPVGLTAVNSASFFKVLAPEAIASAFGAGFAGAVESATQSPLPLSLAGTNVTVTGADGRTESAPLFFVSPSQVNFLVPKSVANGMASVSVLAGGSTVAQGLVEIRPAAPGIFTANSDGKGPPAALVLLVKPDGTRTTAPVFRCGEAAGSCVPLPIDLGAETDQVYLSLFGTGIRGCVSEAYVLVDGSRRRLQSVGPHGQFAGLDQVNVFLDRNLASRGDVEIALFACGQSNPVGINMR